MALGFNFISWDPSGTVQSTSVVPGIVIFFFCAHNLRKF